MTGPSPEDFPETPIEFNTRGGEVKATLTCGQAQMGTYSLRLWSADGKDVVTKARGSFVDEEEDVYPLPPPLADNHLRILQCRSRVWLIRGNKKYAVFMTLTQDSRQIGEVSEEDETDEPTVIIDLRARLVGIRR